MRRTWVALGVLAVVVAAVAAYMTSRAELASGDGRRGEWSVVASRDFGGYCLKRFEPNGEGGACAFAQPGTVNESLSWKLFRGNDPITLVAGPAPSDTTRVEVTPGTGEPVQAQLTKVWGMTFFVAEVPGNVAIEDIVATDDRGGELERLVHAPLPPPNLPLSKPKSQPTP